MIAKPMALARKVDSLFRARKVGRQMPGGERWARGKFSFFTPADEERHTLSLAHDMRLRKSRPEYTHSSEYCSLRQVAMLALTEPGFLKRCLDEIRPITPIAQLRAWEIAETVATPADVARTARYLVDLDARLTEYRKAEAKRHAIKAGQVAAEPIPHEDETAIIAMA